MCTCVYLLQLRHLATRVGKESSHADWYFTNSLFSFHWAENAVNSLQKNWWVLHANVKSLGWMINNNACFQKVGTHFALGFHFSLGFHFLLSTHFALGSRTVLGFWSRGHFLAPVLAALLVNKSIFQYNVSIFFSLTIFESRVQSSIFSRRFPEQ